MRGRAQIVVPVLILLALAVVGVVWFLTDAPADQRLAEKPATLGAEQPAVKDKAASAVESARPDNAKEPIEEIVRPVPKQPPAKKAPVHLPEAPVVKKNEPQKPANPEEIADEGEPDPEKPITVDFINRDAETVLHYVALKSGLRIEVVGSIGTKMTVLYKDTKPREIVEAICKTNNLEWVKEGDLIYIRAKKK